VPIKDVQTGKVQTMMVPYCDLPANATFPTWQAHNTGLFPKLGVAECDDVLACFGMVLHIAILGDVVHDPWGGRT
jgi:hypothetical protein